MENVQFNSIDEVDDISTLDEYQVALDAGFTPQEALEGCSTLPAATMPERHSSGIQVKMPASLRLLPGCA